MNSYCLGLIIAIAGVQAHAVVRTITVDQTTMAEIHLAMGRSTVLHFLEKPTKVVVGNQNYFNIEFTGNDVTIQPLGQVSSNLFAYGEYHRYGFILRVGGAERYDDLVQIRWKSRPISLPQEKSVPIAASHGDRREKAKGIAISLTNVFRKIDLHVIELEIKDKSIDSKHIVVAITQSQKTVPIKQVVFDRDHGDILKARIFAKLSARSAVVRIKVGKRQVQLTIPGNLLK